MNTKICKIQTELEKTKQKISKLQEHMRELEQQKTELENTDIVGLVRDAGMTPLALAALIRTTRGNGGVLIAEPVREDVKNEE